MELAAVEVHVLERQLRAGLATGAGDHRRRPVVLVRVATDLGDGWGECVALAEPTYSEEHADGAVAVLLDHLAPRLLAASLAGTTPGDGDGGGNGGDPSDRGDPGSALSLGARSVAALDGVRGHRMAKAALEMAVLDAALRGEGRSLAAALGAVRTRVPAGATVGLQPAAGDLVAAAERALDAGYRRLKCKVAPGPSAAHVATLRQALPELVVSVDANGSYRPDDPDDRACLQLLDSLGLAAIEQPVDPDDLVAQGRVAAALDTPVLLDEAVRSPGQLEAAAALGAGDALAVKPGPCGGVLAARRLARRCVALGWPCAIGGMLESGLGRAASLAVAALPGFDLPGDLGGSDRYFAEDCTEPHVVVAGELAVPDGPGLGRRPLPEVLATATLAGVCRPPARSGRGGAGR